MINGFKSAFLPFHERQIILRKVSQEIDSLIVETTRTLDAGELQAV